MVCGLSCVLDIKSDKLIESQRLLFNKNLWAEICKKYSNKHSINVPPIPSDIHKTWNLISCLCKTNNDTRKARQLICKLKLATTTVTEERSLDFLSEIVFQIESKKFMLDQNNSSKISERDFAYQLWPPIFTKLFFLSTILFA